MELPTYTSIWRIEKRLYKLYDFRLPMPVPVGQIAVFAAITVPYIVLLTIFGLPFNHNLFWLYVLPPGLLTWLATRPVLESKRLPELIHSQARYLGEPRTWCRMKPLAENDEILVFGRVWRRAGTGSEILEPAAEQLAIAPVVAGQTRRPIAAPSAQRGEKPAELPAGRRARQVAGPARPGAARMRATARAAEPAVGYSATARGAVPVGYPQVVRDPERAPRVPARDPAVPVGYPEAVWEPRQAERKHARGAAPAGYPEAVQDPGQARPMPARGVTPVGYPEAAVGYPETAREPAPARNEPSMGAATAAGRSQPSGVPGRPGTVREPGRTGYPQAGDTARPTGYPSAIGYPAAKGSGPVGYPTAGRDAVPTGYPAARKPEPARHAQAGDAAAPASHPEAARDPAPAGSPEIAHDDRPARHRATATGQSAAASDPGPAGQPRVRGTADSAAGSTAPATRSRATPAPAPASAAPGAPARPAVTPGSAVPGAPARPAAASASAGPSAPARPAVTPGSPSPSAPARPAAAPGSAVPGAPARPGGASGSPAPAAPARPTAAPRPPAPVRLIPARRSVAGPAPASPAPQRSAPAVERVLSGPGEQRSVSWRNHVTVVPGGRGPGRPDPEKEAKARAVLPLNRPRLVVVLGCTVGAGQTVTTLMLADLLARLRDEPVAALDLNPGPASLTELARIPATTVSALLARPPGAHAAHAAGAGHAGQAASVMHRGGSRGRGRLDVICQDATPDEQADGTGASASLQHSRLLDLLASRYLLTLADPGASAVAKVLAAADQLVLVAPASGDAAQAVSMTCEWLGAHGHSTLASHSIAMINGVSRRSVRHAEQAELVLRGRCRAIVRVPWDDHLAEPEAERGIRASLEASGTPSRLDRLHPAVLAAYTALAGVLVSALTGDPAQHRAAR